MKSKLPLIASIILNVVLLIALGLTALLNALKGCPETTGNLFVLKKPVSARCPGSGGELFTLPPGLVVQDVSATGAGWFEVNRFKLVITTDDTALAVPLHDSTLDKCGHGYYYSADRDKSF